MFLLLAIIFFLILFVGLILVIADTIRGSGRFGVNLKIPDCPTCGKKLPAVRTPKSIKQAMWGGTTCPSCGTEVDKWGKIIQSKSEPDDFPKQIEQTKTDYIEHFDEKGKTPIEKVFEEK
jgi:hypothetical protein